MNKHKKHLTLADRIIIATERYNKTSCKDIAKLLNKNPSTISREVHRNSDEDGYYGAHIAHLRAQKRRSEANAGQRTETKDYWQDFLEYRKQNPNASPRLYLKHKSQQEGQKNLSQTWLYELMKRERRSKNSY